MSPLTQAISQGFSADQILQYLIRQSPKYANQIQKALSQGFSANQVVKYLGGGRKGVNEDESTLTEHEKTRKSDYEKQRNLEKNIGKGALALGAAGLGAYGLSRAGQSIIPQVLPQSNEVFNPKQGVEINVTPKIAQQIKQIEFQPPQETIQQAKQPEIPPSAPIIPEQPQQQINFGDLLENMGLKQRVDALRESNPPDIIFKALRYGMNKEQIKQIESQIGVPLDQIVQGYIQSAPPVETLKEKIAKGLDVSLNKNQPSEPKPIEQVQPIEQPSDDSFKNMIEQGGNKYEEWRNQKEITEIPEKPKNRQLKLDRQLEKGSSVLLPDGEMGEIQDIKKGIAKVKIGDRIRSKKIEELFESPKEAAIAALELIKSFTPEMSRSAHHALNTYDPETKSAQFLFHNGEGYIVNDITPEEYERLSNELDEAKTTGENKIGSWSTGAGSRGAAYQKIVKNLKKPYRKIKVGYNLFKEFQRLVNEKEE